jgi:YihY family inner membrane protein
VAPSSRVDAFQQRHRGVGFPLGVGYKFFDDQGNYLAALITYYAFLSLFPMLLLLTSVLGFVLQDNPQLQQELIDSALNQFPVVGDELGNPAGLKGSGTALVLAFVVTLYGALGIAQAGQNAMNAAWAVPRNKRPNPVLVRLRSLLLLGTAGFALVGITLLTILAANGRFGEGPVRTVLFTVATVALYAAVLVLVMRLGTAAALSLRDVLPGAVLGAVLWQTLQLFGRVYVQSVVQGASDTNGTFAVVFGLIAWIYLLSVSFVLCVEVNVVLARRLWPRSLLTPFTDDVDLTSADQRAYRQYATAQRNKGFQTVDVTFEHDGQNASATRTGTTPPDP